LRGGCRRAAWRAPGSSGWSRFALTLESCLENLVVSHALDCSCTSFDSSAAMGIGSRAQRKSTGSRAQIQGSRKGADGEIRGEGTTWGRGVHTPPLENSIMHTPALDPRAPWPSILRSGCRAWLLRATPARRLHAGLGASRPTPDLATLQPHASQQMPRRGSLRRGGGSRCCGARRLGSSRAAGPPGSTPPSP